MVIMKYQIATFVLPFADDSSCEFNPESMLFWRSLWNILSPNQVKIMSSDIFELPTSEEAMKDWRLPILECQAGIGNLRLTQAGIFLDCWSSVQILNWQVCFHWADYLQAVCV